MPSQLVQNTMRTKRLPHIWCPGCGHGILMRDVCQAIENLGLEREKVSIVSGIGLLITRRRIHGLQYAAHHSRAAHRFCNRHQNGTARHGTSSSSLVTAMRLPLEAIT